MKTDTKKTDRLQGQAHAREGGKANDQRADRPDERMTQGVEGRKEFEQKQSKPSSSKPKQLGDESEIEDESTI